MRQMVDLRQGVMRQHETPLGVLHRSGTFGDEVPRIAALIGPMAESSGVGVGVEIHPEAMDLPIGPLGVVLMNGLSNAVEACVSGDEPRQVKLWIEIRAKDTLRIVISDTGPGVGGADSA